MPGLPDTRVTPVLNGSRAFGYADVPLNLTYSANRPNDIIKLPTVLLPSTVHAALDQAGPSSDARETAAK
jgi:hypothetical protein